MEAATTEVLRVKRLSVTSHNRGQGQYTPVSKTTDLDSAVRLIKKSAQFQMRLWGRREVQYALVRLYCGRKYLFFFIHRFGFWTKFEPQEAENAAKVEIRAPPRLPRVVLQNVPLTVAKWIPQPPP